MCTRCARTFYHWDDVLESWTDEDMMAVVRLSDQLRSGVIEVEGKVVEDQ